MQQTYTKQDCIDDLNRVREENPDLQITRDLYRKFAQVPESVWTREFGSFRNLVHAEHMKKGHVVPFGHVVKGESSLVDEHGNVRMRWVKTRESMASEDVMEQVREALQDFDGRAAPVPPPPYADDDLLTVYPIPDLHLGMYAWGAETGANYDLNIACEMAEKNIARLVAQSQPSRRAVLLGLGDYFHANDHKAATPASGHQLDVDGRWPKVAAAGARLALSMVRQIAAKHELVEVVFLPGNHDPDAAVSLTVAMDLYFSADPRIEVFQTPGVVWYKRFGKCLLGATHGHTMKPDRMAMMLASDRAKDWGETLHRHMFFGHIHHETAKEVGPVRCESFSSPAARDSFNANGGYRSGRAFNAITFHYDEGEIGRHRVAILT